MTGNGPERSVMRPADSITAIVCTRDRPRMLEECLARLSESLRAGDHLVVVDSASTSPEVSEVAARHTQHVVRCDRPGLSVARNAGWRAATTEAVLFVDDDVRVAPDWAQCAARVLGEHPEAGFVTGWVGVPPEQTGGHRPVAVADDESPRSLDRWSTGSWGHGANMATRRSVLEQLGGFDDLLGAGSAFPGAEDYDFFDRVFDAGMGGRFDPRLRAFHEQWRDPRALVRLDYRYGKGAGARIRKQMSVRSDTSTRSASRHRARVFARAYLWDIGVWGVVVAFRERYKLAAAAAVARVTGTIVGLAWAATMRVEEGHLVPHRRVGPRPPASERERRPDR
jgi:GT2 family glycosyltransferase